MTEYRFRVGNGDMHLRLNVVAEDEDKAVAAANSALADMLSSPYKALTMISRVDLTADLAGELFLTPLTKKHIFTSSPVKEPALAYAE